MTQYLTIDADPGTRTEQRFRALFGTEWSSVPTVDMRDGVPVNMASENDRQWFEDFPTRCVRLRYPVNGDQHLFGGEPPAGYALVLVFCPSTGARIRLPIRNEPTDPPPEGMLGGLAQMDVVLARMLEPTLNEVRRVWGDRTVDHLQESLRRCVQSGARLTDWCWL